MVKLHFRPLISRRAAGACNTMKTLQEIAVMTILKFGIPYRKTLPPILQDEIDTLEHTVRRTCTGSDYYEAYRVHNCLNFDISWSYGTWTFVQRGLFEGNDYDQRTVCIRAGKETFMSWVWGNVFGLQFGTQDAGTCFMVTDFQMEPSTSRLEFKGFYYCQDSGKRRTFKSTFQFSATKFYVRVTAEEKWVSEDGTEENFWESCFQKPDPNGLLQSWDDQFHDPPFIQSTQDFLAQEVWS